MGENGEVGEGRGKQLQWEMLIVGRKCGFGVLGVGNRGVWGLGRELLIDMRRLWGIGGYKRGLWVGRGSHKRYGFGVQSSMGSQFSRKYRVSHSWVGEWVRESWKWYWVVSGVLWVTRQVRLGTWIERNLRGGTMMLEGRVLRTHRMAMSRMARSATIESMR